MSILLYCQGDDGQILQAFRDRLPEHEIIDWHSDSALSAPEKITAAIVWMPPDDFFDKLGSLQQVYAFSAGVDHLLQHPGLPESVTIIRLQDAGMSQQMAEYALYGTLHYQRQMGMLRKAQQRSEWCRDVKALTAANTGVGVLGAGALGLQVATRISLNGYPVRSWSRSARPSPDGKVSMFHAEEGLSEFLADSQVLVCLLPLTEATRGILNTRLFDQLPRGAFLINPGRGDHLNDADLLNALDSGQLSGALLDVFSTEPLPPAHPFWQHPDIIITPHVAAQSLTGESVGQIAANIEAIDRGEPPSGVVSRQSGY